MRVCVNSYYRSGWKSSGRSAGCGDVRIYHDHALFKEAGGRATYWHQDQYYWPLDTADTVTMAML